MGTEKKYAKELADLADRLALVELEVGTAIDAVSKLLRTIAGEENDGEHEPVRREGSGADPRGEPGDGSADDRERPTAVRAEVAGAERAIPAAPVHGAEDGQAESRLSHWARRTIYDQLPACELEDEPEAVPPSCLWCGDTGYDETAERPCPVCELGDWNIHTEMWDEARQGR